MRPQTVRVEDTDREKWNEGLQRGGGFVSTGVTSGIPNLEMTAKNGATWSVQDALGLYNIENWGADYFSVNEKGAVTVAPLQSKGATIAVMEVLDEALRRGMGLPILIRFQDLLRHRVESVNEAFKAAIAETAVGRKLGVESTPTLHVVGPKGETLVKGLVPMSAVEAAVKQVMTGVVPSP